jgi:hypothetical protein
MEGRSSGKGESMSPEERLNRSLGQKGRWIKEELAQMAEGARVRVDEILGLRLPSDVKYPWFWRGEFNRLPF